MKNKNLKKMIVPIIIAVLVGLYFLAMAVHLISLSIIKQQWWVALFALIPIILLCILIYVTFERIKEIKGGQEDDLSKY